MSCIKIKVYRNYVDIIKFMKKYLMIVIFILFCISANGRNGQPITICNTIDSCSNTDNCAIEFSSKYIMALNFIVQTDSVLKNHQIRVSNMPASTNYSTFYEYLDNNVKKIAYDSISRIRTNIAFENYKFIFTNFIDTILETHIVLHFSKITGNDLFVWYDLPQRPVKINYRDDGMSFNYTEEVENNMTWKPYYVKFKGNEIDKVYTVFEYEFEEWERLNETYYVSRRKIIEIKK